MRPSRRLALLALLAALGLARCGGAERERDATTGSAVSTPEPPSGQDTAAAPEAAAPRLAEATPEAPLEDTPWGLLALPGAPDPPAGAGATLVLEREGGFLRGSTGCGTIDGSWELAGSRLRLGVGAVGPEPCAPELRRLQVDYLEALRRAGSYRLRGDTLELLGAEGVVARFGARPGARPGRR